MLEKLTDMFKKKRDTHRLDEMAVARAFQEGAYALRDNMDPEKVDKFIRSTRIGQFLYRSMQDAKRIYGENTSFQAIIEEVKTRLPDVWEQIPLDEQENIEQLMPVLDYLYSDWTKK